MSLKGRSCWVVNIRMNDAEKLSLEAIGQFVAASEEVRFEAQDRQQVYDWVEQVLVGQQYALLGKVARGLVRRYIEKMTGLSRAHGTRLIARYTASGRVEVTVYRRRRFAQLYTRADIELLASVDEAHQALSGPATRRILEREHTIYKRPEYARLLAKSTAVGERHGDSHHRSLTKACGRIGSSIYLRTPAAVSPSLVQSVLRKLVPGGNQHRNPIKDRVGSAAVAAEQAGIFQAEFPQTSRAGQPCNHQRVERGRNAGSVRHLGSTARWRPARTPRRRPRAGS
jgi:hypothetical protein